jgi:tripartite-type tricarboxylate transporter receptor subunit TctC
MAHPARNLAEWAAWSKAQGETPWASPAAGSVPHFVGIMLGRRLGLNLTHVPYRGGAPAVQDVIGGRLPLFVGVLSEVLPHHNQGLRIIAVTSPARFSKLPDVPTLAELGYDTISDSPFGLAGPAGMDAGAVRVLHDAFRKALDEPRVRELLERFDQPVIYMGPEEYSRWARQTYEAERGTIERLGLKGSM